MTNRLTKFNPESGQYEYKEAAKTLDEFKAQRKAAIQRLGELEDSFGQESEKYEQLSVELDAMRGAAEAWKEHSKTLEGENENLKNLVDKCFDTENALNEKVKELTEENEYLKQQNEIYAVLNEKMQSICDSYAFQYGTVIPKEVFLKKEREKAVKELQERLSEQFHDRVAYTRSYVHDTIDQIAKEMLEGEK